MRPLSHIAVIRAQHAYNELQILWLTGIAPEELESYRSYLGKQWIQQQTAPQRTQINNLLNHPLVWKWWAHEWARRDDVVILSALYCIIPAARLEQYKELHQMVFTIEAQPYRDLTESFKRLCNIINEISI